MHGRTDEERHYYWLNEKAWSVLAPFYDLITRPLAKLRGDVAVMAPIGPESRVLDVATGTGAQARAFARRAGKVVGIDLSEAMLRIARQKNHSPNLTFQKADATELHSTTRSSTSRASRSRCTRCRRRSESACSRRWRG